MAALAAAASVAGIPAPAYMEELESSQDHVRTWAKMGAAHGAALVVGHQTKGRGRRGRVWEMLPSQGIALSVLLWAHRPPEAWGLLSLAAGVATAEACGPHWGLKWPNDVVDAEGAKVAGVLLESERVQDRWAILVGIGINRGPLPIDVGRPVASLGSDAPKPASLVVDVVRRLVQLVAEPDAIVLDRWRRRDQTLGRRVRTAVGEGIAEGIGPKGALLVRAGTGSLHRVTAGEIMWVDSQGR